MYPLTFLSADFPLTKSYTRNPDGSLDSTPYPLTSYFTSHKETYITLEEFHSHIVRHAKAGHCLLKGNLTQQLRNESRAGLIAIEMTRWICLDLDSLNAKGKSIDEILVEIGLGNVSYILQYSASEGIKDGLNAHIFMLLKDPIPADHLKQWLKSRNMMSPFFRNQLRLTKSQMALHWNLDVTVCQNDKLLYIAPPQLKGMEDPLKDKERISLVIHDKPYAEITDVSPSIDVDAREEVKRLRAVAGLPEHKLEVKFFKQDGAEIMINPDHAAVTGIKRARGFVYLALNGGRTYGYFHKENSPELLYNFKSEPIYRTREISPSYYVEALAHAKKLKRDAHKPSQEKAKIQRWVANNRADGHYYKVTYDPATGVTLDVAPSMKHVEDWCILNQIPAPDAIDDWDIAFDPTSVDTIDINRKRINLYRPTEYKLAALVPIKTYEGKFPEYDWNVHVNMVPDIYWKLIYHVCGNDNEAAQRLINWLAFIWQTGKRPKSAWVLHGTYGTGKGRLLRVLRFLFGEQCVVTSPEAINEQFNGFMEHAQILWIDEVTTESWDNAKITPKLRNWIDGGDTVSIRGMRKDWREVFIYMGIMVAANEHNPVEIRKGDRRWNVAPRQEIPLNDMSWATDDLLDDEYGLIYQPDNLQALAQALTDLQVDTAAARIPMENAAKTSVMNVTQSLPEDIVQALQSGNVSFFLQHVAVPGSMPSIDAVEYKKVVGQLMAGGRMGLRTTDIGSIFRFLAGWNSSPGKFAKALSRYGMSLGGKKARIGDTIVAGDYFTFTVTEEDRSLWAQLAAQPLALVGQTKQAVG